MVYDNDVEYGKERCSKPVDVCVGARIRLRRIQLGMSQETLADRLRITYQQVQKYEKAINRVGASRLFEIARELKVAVSYFFEDVESPENAIQCHRGDQEDLCNNKISDILRDFGSFQMSYKEIFDLVQVYYKIPSSTRKRFLEFMNSIAR